MLKTLLLCVSLAGIVTSQIDVYEAKNYTFGVFPGFLGFYPGISPYERETLVNHYKGQCMQCLARRDSNIALTEACNIYLTCVDFGSIVYMYARSCGTGSMYFSEEERCDYYPPENTPLNCTNPCATGTRVPLDEASCGPYYTCEYDMDGKVIYKRDACESGYGLNVKTGQCDWPCPGYSTREIVVNETCSAADDDDHFMVEPLIEVTGSDGSKTYRAGATSKRRCPASLQHDKTDKCLCDQVKQEKCQEETSVRLSSVDNTWFLALNNTLPGNSSIIHGNASVTNQTDEFPQSAFFRQRTVFMAPGLILNDIGERFSFTFDFLARTKDSNYQNAGVSIPNDGLQLNHVALIDNSNCGIQPTYGCLLKVSSANRGNVVCYVKPGHVDADKHREVESPSLDLTRRITVYFAKDGTNGELTVSEEGRAPTTTEVTFPEGVRALGNKCPLTLAGGTDKRYFTGYMDNVLLRKFCDSFL